MAMRVVARIRPQQHLELGKDVIISTATSTPQEADLQTLVKIPNPKNESEAFTFQFSSVYDGISTQQQIFDNEIAPTIKHLLNGFDVTIFAYGSTGTGKTHTMRGGKTLAERGIIPRLLSSIYRRARKIDKDSGGTRTVDISLTYFEIYNDRVFDLFEASEKRTLAGLSLRDNGGKTIVVGLTERPCESLKDFERLYDQANINRSTSATKLNAVSSRSHAILGIKVAVTKDDEVRISTASAIDLAGSEDNRRTENGKDRMVESASINKSLFVLAKCVEAIGSESARVPYRESKMTRILSLGQNNGLTIMILNLAPVRSYHLDTLSSLNFANRTKKIQVREIENEPIFKGCSRAIPPFSGKTIDRQPLRSLATTAYNSSINASNLSLKQGDRKAKAFAVYSDRSRYSTAVTHSAGVDVVRRLSPRKRPSDPFVSSVSRPSKRRSPDRAPSDPRLTMSKQAIEDLIQRKVEDILAARALDQPSIAPQPEISEEVQRRLDLLEQRLDGKDDGREQGLWFLLMAKQHAVRGEHCSALKMYSSAKDFFPDNKKLDVKIEKLRGKVQEKEASGKRQDTEEVVQKFRVAKPSLVPDSANVHLVNSDDNDYKDEEVDEESDYQTGFSCKTKAKKANSRTAQSFEDSAMAGDVRTPRVRQLLNIVNTRDVSQIRLLKGVGVKKAEAIVEALGAGASDGKRATTIHSLEQLGRLRGVSAKTIEAILQTTLPLG